MKKFAVILLLVGLVTAGLSAENADYVSFEIGSMPTYDLASKDVSIINSFGLQFQFNDVFSAGFRFLSPNSIQLLHLSVFPVENLSIALYTGSISNEVGFGLGVGYDFLSKKDSLFYSLGLYLDWLASNTAKDSSYSIENGGAFSIGLKVKMGI